MGATGGQPPEAVASRAASPAGRSIDATRTAYQIRDDQINYVNYPGQLTGDPQEIVADVVLPKDVRKTKAELLPGGEADSFAVGTSGAGM